MRETPVIPASIYVSFKAVHETFVPVDVFKKEGV
jgi:hypothetical protein